MSPTLSEIILPALSHHVSSTIGARVLDVYVWDGKTTGVGLPSTPWPTSTDQAWQCETPDYFGLYLPVLKSLLWVDRHANRAIYWSPDASQIPLTEAGSPLLLLWGTWLSDFGLHLVHAAAVAGPNGAALLLGPGGSGKSSTALSCLNSPLKYLGDDYCLIRTEPEPVAISLYCSGKINRVDRNFYPHLEPAYAGENEQKILYQLVPSFQDRLCTDIPIAALFALSVIRGGKNRIESISSMNALRMVAPNTVLQLRVGIDSRKTLSALGAIAKHVPCFSLKLSGTREDATQCLSDYLSG